MLRSVKGIKPAGEIGRRYITDRLVQFPWLLPHGDGVEVHHAIDALMGILHMNPVEHGTKIIAQMQITGGLHAGKNPWSECGHGKILCKTWQGLCPQKHRVKRGGLVWPPKPV